mmetsp:Transcript_35820/g.65025  ORF Transcript_35820/g.65025 Transcript_35820/m.65025 type:complete len:336 (+) Transcript_35820:38-1045(+)
MGATASYCGVKVSTPSLGGLFGAEEEAMVLEVLQTSADDSAGARPSGFMVGDELYVRKLESPNGFEPLGFRYRENVRSSWPDDYRFQATRRAWQAMIAGGLTQKDSACILQMASRQEERTLDCAALDLEDAKCASSYAHRFNLYHRKLAADAGMANEEPMPSIKVAAPVACRVRKSSLPALLPVGATCTLTVYPSKEVSKFVFNGSEDFLEMAQAFFHHAAFSSGGKELVCDIQGWEEEDGSLLLVDPCILRADKVSIGGLVAGAVAGKTAPEIEDEQVTVDCLAPAAARVSAADKFDQLHPKCAQLCKAFDPKRSSVQRKAGVCGVDVMCGFGK